MKKNEIAGENEFSQRDVYAKKASDIIPERRDMRSRFGYKRVICNLEIKAIILKIVFGEITIY